MKWVMDAIVALSLSNLLHPRFETHDSHPRGTSSESYVNSKCLAVRVVQMRL